MHNFASLFCTVVIYIHIYINIHVGVAKQLYTRERDQKMSKLIHTFIGLVYLASLLAQDNSRLPWVAGRLDISTPASKECLMNDVGSRIHSTVKPGYNNRSGGKAKDRWYRQGVCIQRVNIKKI